LSAARKHGWHTPLALARAAGSAQAPADAHTKPPPAPGAGASADAFVHESSNGGCDAPGSGATSSPNASPALAATRAISASVSGVDGAYSSVLHSPGTSAPLTWLHRTDAGPGAQRGGAATAADGGCRSDAPSTALAMIWNQAISRHTPRPRPTCTAVDAHPRRADSACRRSSAQYCSRHLGDTRRGAAEAEVAEGGMLRWRRG
jgi:hypothetical protein